MSAMAFDSLRFARRLKDAGVPEPQADAHAELMAETLPHFAENLLTKDHFEAVLEARFAAQDARLAVCRTHVRQTRFKVVVTVQSC
ncbi:hypothetical protein [Chromatocurvus halotolerans]|uniref:DUF1640 domain-containing protein n=1 Tax=Chromatocurvus halotolerans TaxID=1132028 RepID=A0A4R2KCN8_9GAMM|nr:hypothetical protein [Chromatocurvus halotolerans]TCO69877.1 hypothetical protein EV688_12910 [Chromatocurvus halotolerans]